MALGLNYMNACYYGGYSKATIKKAAYSKAAFFMPEFYHKT
jgi:hypothetical protein